MPFKYCFVSGCLNNSWQSDSVKFVRFVNPKTNHEKAKQWIKLCGRPDFPLENITRDTYVCLAHSFALEKSEEQNSSMNLQLESSSERPDHDFDCSINLAQFCTKNYYIRRERAPKAFFIQLPCSSCARSSSKEIDVQEPDIKKTSKASKSNENVRDEEVVKIKYSRQPQPVTSFLENDEKAKFFTGMSTEERFCLWEFLGPAKYNLHILGRSLGTSSSTLQSLSVKCQFLLTLVILRRNKTYEECHYLFGISTIIISDVFKSWVLFMYSKFKDIKDCMFIKRNDTDMPLPAPFQNKLLRNVRVVIDCTEIYVQGSGNYTQQGNLYSNYKSATTVKVLIGVTPHGCACFISDAYEGSISDREITIKSGFLSYLDKGDVVLADRGFTIEDLCLENGANLVIPPFLQGRSKFTLEEEALTKVISKARIHIERWNQRLKKFLFLKYVPQYHFPILNQAIYVCACLANFLQIMVE